MPDRTIAKLFKCTRREWFILFEALWQLGSARLRVLLVPFNRIAASLGNHGQTAPEVLTPQQSSRAKQIGWAVRAIARRTPWNSNCLAQAIAAQWMLQHRGIPSTLYLGVRKSADDADNIDAHAWLTCGDMILTGKRQYLAFTIVSQFGD